MSDSEPLKLDLSFQEGCDRLRQLGNLNLVRMVQFLETEFVFYLKNGDIWRIIVRTPSEKEKLMECFCGGEGIRCW